MAEWVTVKQFLEYLEPHTETDRSIQGLPGTRINGHRLWQKGEHGKQDSNYRVYVSVRNGEVKKISARVAERFLERMGLDPRDVDEILLQD